jgi:hypothetical protein
VTGYRSETGRFGRQSSRQAKAAGGVLSQFGPLCSLDLSLNRKSLSKAAFHDGERVLRLTVDDQGASSERRFRSKSGSHLSARVFLRSATRDIQGGSFSPAASAPTSRRSERKSVQKVLAELFPGAVAQGVTPVFAKEFSGLGSSSNGVPTENKPLDLRPRIKWGRVDVLSEGSLVPICRCSSLKN